MNEPSISGPVVLWERLRQGQVPGEVVLLTLVFVLTITVPMNNLLQLDRGTDEPSRLAVFVKHFSSRRQKRTGWSPRS